MIQPIAVYYELLGVADSVELLDVNGGMWLRALSLHDLKKNLIEISSGLIYML